MGQVTSLFCAICTDPVKGDAYRREPLGKDGGVVVVCLECSDVEVTEQGPRLTGYEPPYCKGSDLAVLAKARKAVKGDYVDPFINVTPRVKRHRPGHLIRVVRRPPKLTAQEAMAFIADKPWASKAKYIGMTQTHAVYDIPDPCAGQVSEKPLVDIVAELANLAGRDDD